MSTINKLPFSNQFERGHSFNWAGDWIAGNYYYNDEYVTDFVVYNMNVVLWCKENHLANEDNASEGNIIGVDSALWRFVLHSELSSKEDIIAILGDDLPFVKGSAPYSAKMNESGDSSEATQSFTIAGNTLRFYLFVSNNPSRYYPICIYSNLT